MVVRKFQVALSGKHLEALEKIAEANHKREGAVLGEMVRDMLDSMIPVLEATTEAQAYKVIFREALNKLSGLFDDDAE